MKCYSWSIAFYVAETWILRTVDQKYPDSSEIWCWKRKEKTKRINHAKNEEVLQRVNEKRTFY
jgi:hypothetical protein